MIDYELKSNWMFYPIVECAHIKPSTSADGWKYYKPNKKRKKNKR